jgi:hypothetical protein
VVTCGTGTRAPEDPIIEVKGGSVTIALEGNTLLIDEYLGEYDFTRIEHLVIDAPTSAVYETLRDLDLLMVRSPIADLAMFVRGLPDKIGKIRRHNEPPAPPLPAFKLSALFDREGFEHPETLEGWIGLAEEHGREISFGAVGKPWMAEIEWKTVPAFDFAGFDEPGWAKIAASVSVREYGSKRTIVTYEARTALTDDASRDRFRRYWTLVSPFVGTIMKAMLRTIDERLEAATVEA